MTGKYGKSEKMLKLEVEAILWSFIFYVFVFITITGHIFIDDEKYSIYMYINIFFLVFYEISEVNCVNSVAGRSYWEEIEHAGWNQ